MIQFTHAPVLRGRVLVLGRALGMMELRVVAVVPKNAAPDPQHQQLAYISAISTLLLTMTHLYDSTRSGSAIRIRTCSNSRMAVMAGSLISHDSRTV